MSSDNFELPQHERWQDDVHDVLIHIVLVSFLSRDRQKCDEKNPIARGGRLAASQRVEEHVAGDY